MPSIECIGNVKAQLAWTGGISASEGTLARTLDRWEQQQKNKNIG